MKYSFLVVISVLLGSSSCETTKKEEETTHLTALDSIIESMEIELSVLEDEMKKMAAFSSLLFKNQGGVKRNEDIGQIVAKEDSAFLQSDKFNTKSTVYISSLSPNKEEVIRQVHYTAKMDSVFHETIQEFPLISQVYFNSRLQYSRLYPPYDHLSTLGKNLDITAFNFYYLGDETRNPKKGPVWVKEVYIDPAGRGWILSLIHPVYHQKQLEGVMGIDITLSDLMDNFLNKSEKKIFIIDEKGTIVAGKSESIEALSMPPLRNHTYIQTINSNSFRKEDFNLFKSKSKEVRQMASRFLLEKKHFFLVESGIKPYHAYCRKINLLNWYLIELDI
ncbi:MAG: cysteine protease [Anditalea sp.]